MIHQPLGGVQGQATDIDIQAREILRMRETLDEILSRHTGQTLEQIHSDTERDFFMTGKDAKEYGLIDDIITSRDEKSEKPKSGPCLKRAPLMAKKVSRDHTLRCSFCGKTQEEVKKLIAGPTVYICDQCIDLCNDIMVEEWTRRRAKR